MSRARKVVKLLGSHVPGRVRVYCPSCGEVRGSAQYTHPQSGKAHVYSHHRTVGPGPQEQCPGGPVDLETDGAT